MICKKYVGCCDPRIKNSYCVRVYNIAVNSLMSVESLSSTFVNNLEIEEIRFLLLEPLCDCNSAAPILKFEPSHKA